MDRIEALEEHWKNEPPVHLLVASFLGFKRKDSPPTASSDSRSPGSTPSVGGKKLTADGVSELMRMFPSGTIKA